MPKLDKEQRRRAELLIQTRGMDDETAFELVELTDSLAALRADNERLREALTDVSERTMADESLCWCIDNPHSKNPVHASYCAAARAALEKE